MKKNRAVEALQRDIVIPNVVRQRADLVFEQIQKEKKRDGGGAMRYSGKAVRRGMWAAVAAAVFVFGTVAYAAYMHWSYGMEERLNATQEQKEYLEENQIATPINSSVTKEGITVTLQQSIVDARFAHLSFRVEGYEVREGSILQPAFEHMSVTVDGRDCGMVTGSFFSNWHITDDERTYTDDGTPIKERKDGTLIERYMNEDGSMEYIVSFMTDSKGHSLIGELVHIDFHNLGSVVRYSDAYRKDVDATWSFDLTLEGSDQVRSLELSEPLGDTGAVVTKAEISPISLYVEYHFPMQEVEIEGMDEEGNLTTAYATPPRLTGVRLKNGTLYTTICNGGSEGYEDGDSTYVACYAINHIIAPEEIDALLLIKSIPETGVELTEENLYIVTF